MHSIRLSSSLIRLLTSTTSILVAGCILFLSTLAAAQDSPGRFEAGASFSTLHMPGIAGLGPALEGDVNFGRYISLDGSLSWFPTRPGGQSAATGFFGAKAGKRTERFGFFGKARPGFLTFDNAFRGETLILTPAPNGIGSISTLSSFRFGRLTQRALDLGGVAEYYPARHWALPLGPWRYAPVSRQASNIHLHWRRNTGLARPLPSVPRVSRSISNSARAYTIGFKRRRADRRHSWTTAALVWLFPICGKLLSFPL